MKKSTKFFIGMSSALVLGLSGFGVGLAIAPDTNTAQSVTEEDKAYIEELENQLSDITEDYNQLKEDFNNISTEINGATLTKDYSYIILSVWYDNMSLDLREENFDEGGYFPDVESLKENINFIFMQFDEPLQIYNNAIEEGKGQLMYNINDTYTIRIDGISAWFEIPNEQINLPANIPLEMKIKVNGVEINREELDSYLTDNMGYNTRFEFVENDLGEITDVIYNVNIFSVEV